MIWREGECRGGVGLEVVGGATASVVDGSAAVGMKRDVVGMRSCGCSNHGVVRWYLLVGHGEDCIVGRFGWVALSSVRRLGFAAWFVALGVANARVEGVASEVERSLWDLAA